MTAEANWGNAAVIGFDFYLQFFQLV